MKNFITNSGADKLEKRLKELIETSDELKFLVAYFYFSGIKELYENLKKNPDVILKVLVGLNVDKMNNQLIEFSINETQVSSRQISEMYFESIRTFTSSTEFDKKEFFEQAPFFIDLLNQNRLIIRKTNSPNHSKLYIFNLNKSQVGRDKLFITGSSNLTKAGLTTQNEFNVEISDYGVADAEAYFDDLWENKSMKITEIETYKEKLINLLKYETLLREITPFEAYAYVLKSYLDLFKGKELSDRVKEILQENNYKVYHYQIDAIKQALSIIENHNGVIIADVVGLGKTIIASAVAYELKKRGIVIAPPSIVGDKEKNYGWKKYLEEFKLASLGWEAYSLGDLESVFNVVSKSKDIEVVIIDEAHRFRNQNTKDYELLKNICRGKIVILLTATPFNNKPADIFSLLKLFILPKKSSITLSNNLEAKFDDFGSIFDKLSYIKRNYKSSDSKKRENSKKKYKSIFNSTDIDPDKIKLKSKQIAKEIREVIEPVIIRRNRLDLQKNPYYKNEIKELSTLADPSEWFYELTPEQSEFYDLILKYFANPQYGGQFRGAIYRPFAYQTGVIDYEEIQNGDNGKNLSKDAFRLTQQFNLYEFMRRLIVKRFESSFNSFKETIENFKKIHKNALDFIKLSEQSIDGGLYILNRKLIDQLLVKDESDNFLKILVDNLEKSTERLKQKIERNEKPSHKDFQDSEVYEISKFKSKKEFVADIESDIKLFENILSEIGQLDLLNNDPKSNCLIKEMRKILNEQPQNNEPKRKIVVFSEYIDTITYLADAFNKTEFKDRVLVVPGKLSKKTNDQIYENFDASYNKQSDDFDILLSTDKTSEGYNLNRAGMVINYDIPWNPVRVIQRVGRINRISKKVFDKLYIVNFFPTELGSNQVRSREIAQNKMFLIHNALGEDVKIFDNDEEPTPSELYKRITQNVDSLEGESFYTRMLSNFEKIKSKYPDIVKSLDNFPKRLKVAKNSTDNELLVIIKKSMLFINYANYSDGSKELNLNFEDVYDKIITDYDNPCIPLSLHFWDYYEELKNIKEQEHSTYNDNSLQQKAYNLLKFLKKSPNQKIEPLKDFIDTLLEDITDFGTLPDNTLRKIIELENNNISDEYINNVVKTLTEIEKQLGGGNYLEKEKQRQKKFTREVILAIENHNQSDIQLF